MKRFTFFLLSALISISITGNAQNSITGKEVNSKKEYPTLTKVIDNYNIYEIDITKNQLKLAPGNFEVNLKLGTRKFKLNLYQENLSVSAKIKDKPLLLGGSLNSGGIVSLTINDDFIYGFIKNGSEKIFIEPLNYIEKGEKSNLYLVYDAQDVKEDTEHICGVTETAKETHMHRPTKTITECKLIDLAIANTSDMHSKYGGTTGVTNHNLAVLNNVQTNYRSEFDINVEFDVVDHYIPSNSANDPLDPNTSSSNGGTMLANFRNWAQGSGAAGGGNSGGSTGGFGVDYTMATLWTDRDITFNGQSGVVGLAYTPGWHHLLEDYTTNAAALNVMVSHEKGHNFSANHDASGSNFIMAPSVTLTDNWSNASKNSINNRLGNQTYLDNCSDLGAPTAGYFSTSIAVCNGSSIDYEEQSQFGATRDWTFFGGSPGTSTEEKETVTYNTNGLWAVKLESNNTAGSDTFFGYVDIEDAPPTPCTPSGSGGSAGITFLRLTNVNHSSTTTGAYQDFSCDHVATLEESTTYNMVVGVSGVTRLRYFIDYNDDGDFTDAGEASNTFSFSGNGGLSVSLETPANPVNENILRFRITTSTSSINANGCTSPTTGQVEDYGIYFEADQVFGCTDMSASNYNPNATVDDGSCNSGNPIWFLDNDNDSFGDSNNSISAPTQPAGYVADNTDCDDTDDTVFPGAPELCDGIINDCDTANLPDNETDNDIDQYVECTIDAGGWDGIVIVIGGDDCDDNNQDINPGETEICDGIDNNCDGNIDEGVTNTYYADTDDDGYGDIANTIEDCTPPAGYVTDNTDCDDNNQDINPGATEVCDGVDNNCDGNIDEGVTTTYYQDSDGDTYGNINVTTEACSQPTGYVTNSTDCNDNNAAINPGATEVCDGVDNNCDGTIDEGCSSNTCDGSFLIINTITQNIYRAEINIESTASINSTNAILFTAGTDIDLKPGFEVISGTDFEARIESCTLLNSDPATSRAQIGDLKDKIYALFSQSEGPLNVTVIDKHDKAHITSSMALNGLEQFILNNMNLFKKGAYKIIINDFEKELVQDIFVIQ